MDSSPQIDVEQIARVIQRETWTVDDGGVPMAQCRRAARQVVALLAAADVKAVA